MSEMRIQPCWMKRRSWCIKIQVSRYNDLSAAFSSGKCIRYSMVRSTTKEASQTPIVVKRWCGQHRISSNTSSPRFLSIAKNILMARSSTKILGAILSGVASALFNHRGLLTYRSRRFEKPLPLAPCVLLLRSSDSSTAICGICKRYVDCYALIYERLS